MALPKTHKFRPSFSQPLWSTAHEKNAVSFQRIDQLQDWAAENSPLNSFVKQKYLLGKKKKRKKKKRDLSSFFSFIRNNFPNRRSVWGCFAFGWREPYGRSGASCWGSADLGGKRHCVVREVLAVFSATAALRSSACRSLGAFGCICSLSAPWTLCLRLHPGVQLSLPPSCHFLLSHLILFWFPFSKLRLPHRIHLFSHFFPSAIWQEMPRLHKAALEEFPVLQLSPPCPKLE